MESYPVPPDVPADITAEQAQAGINQLNAAFAADLEHPAFCRNHPQHMDFSAYSTKLHTIVAQAKADAQEAREAQQVDDLLSGNTPRQRALRKEAAEEMRLLVSLGFEETAIDPHIRPDEVTGLKMQRLGAQGDFDGLRPILLKELSALRAPASTMALFSSYVNAPDDLDPDLRAGVGDQLIAWIQAANEKRYGKPSTPLEDEE